MYRVPVFPKIWLMPVHFKFWPMEYARMGINSLFSWDCFITSHLVGYLHLLTGRVGGGGRLCAFESLGISLPLFLCQAWAARGGVKLACHLFANLGGIPVSWGIYLFMYLDICSLGKVTHWGMYWLLLKAVNRSWGVPRPCTSFHLFNGFLRLPTCQIFWVTFKGFSLSQNQLLKQ